MTLSSMNNEDIKEYKERFLLNERSFKNNISYKEIDDLIDPKQLKIKDNEMDNKLNYLGRTFDNYNIFKSLIKQNKDVDKYIEKRREHIKKKIYEYFGILNNIHFTKIKNLYKFLSFSVYSKYSFSEFKKILENIPFKYFHIYKETSKENNEDYIQIDYRFPVIQDIIEKIYAFIILRKDISNIIKSTALDGGSKSLLFEKFVMHNLTPGEHNEFCINFFEEFLVEKTYSIPKYIPKDNEKIKLEGNNKKIIENKPFLLKQGIFGGKDLDIVIIEFYGDKYADIFCFQIAKYKQKKDLYTFTKLESNLLRMEQYLKNFFDFQICSIYFSYIFDYNKLKEKKMINMYNNCEKENIKYIFYDINTLSFYDKNGTHINIRQDMNKFNLIKKETNTKVNFEINENQKKQIHDILNKIYKYNNGFKFFGSGELNLEKLNRFGLFMITELSFFDKDKKIPKIVMFLKEQNKYKCIELKKVGKSEVLNDLVANLLLMLQNKFDYYKIKNEDFMNLDRDLP